MLEYVWTPYADIDEENVKAMIRCNMAHVVMLHEQRILSRKEAAAIMAALTKAERLKGDFPYDPVKGDLFFNVEAFVIAHAGADLGGKMHVGRSRIDLIAALMRLKVRKNLTRIIALVARLQEAVLSRAEETADAVMPAYTHLQPAQVATFGHYLLAFHDVLGRDLRRLHNAYESTNMSPLGAAASSGTSWPLDRQRVAELLGFEGVVENTKDAAHNYDWLPEVLAAAGILMNNVVRFATDLYIWCSHEFRLVELDGAFAASSSIMPQKKNPYSLEMIRARTGEITGAFAAVLEILKGDTGGTAFDIKLTGPRIADNAVNRTADMVALLTPLVSTLIVHRERMLERAGDGFTTAVSLADAMVERGLSFRTAHHIMGRLVRMATERDLSYREIDSRLLDEAARETTGKPLGMSDESIRKALDPRDFVLKRNGHGGTSPRRVRQMIAARTKAQKRSKAAIEAMLQNLERSDATLLRLVDKLAAYRAFGR
jgi:argininosuccinate lyase